MPLCVSTGLPDMSCMKNYFGKRNNNLKNACIILENVAKIFSFFQYSILYWNTIGLFLIYNMRIIESSVVFLRALIPLNPKYGWLLYVQNVPLL